MAARVGLGSLLTCCVVGCTGRIEVPRQPAGAPPTRDDGTSRGDDASDPESGDGPGASGDGPGGGKARDESAVVPPDLTVPEKCSDKTRRGGARDAVRRLTKAELAATLADLNPEGFWELEAQMASYPETGGAHPGEQFQPMHGAAEVEAWIELAVRAGELFAQYDRQDEHVRDLCTRKPTVEPACWSELVRNVGLLTQRRPLREDEQATYEQLVRGEPDTRTAVKRMFTRMLLSPSFVFHIELGERDAEGRTRLGPYEVASRISYAVTGSLPDAALFAAAERGDLTDLASVEAQTRRLLASDKAKQRFRRFVSEWLNLPKIPDPSQSLAALLGFEYANTRALDEAYRSEIYDFVAHVIWGQKGTFRDLMTARVAFPKEPRLATIYGTAESRGDAPVPSPDHPGLITRAGLLASALESTSPIMRGATLRRRVLCDVLPTPDFTVVQQRLIDLGAHDHATTPNHEIVSQTTADPTCMKCHEAINPLGFVLEPYDAMGKTQKSERVIMIDPLSSQPKLVTTHPLPGPQTDLTIEPGLPTRYASPEALASAFGDSQKARTCMITRLFRHNEQRAESADDACALAEPITRLRDDVPIFEALVASVANEDIFWRRAP